MRFSEYPYTEILDAINKYSNCKRWVFDQDNYKHSYFKRLF